MAFISANGDFTFLESNLYEGLYEHKAYQMKSVKKIITIKVDYDWDFEDVADQVLVGAENEIGIWFIESFRTESVEEGIADFGFTYSPANLNFDDTCKYAVIKNTPKKRKIEFIKDRVDVFEVSSIQRLYDKQFEEDEESSSYSSY